MADPITSYPLCWPIGWKRTPVSSRSRARFTTANRDPATSTYRFRNSLTVAAALKRLVAELQRLGVPDYNVIVSTNIRTRQDGLPYSNQSEPQDAGAAVYFRRKNDASNQKCLAIDRYDRVADNLAAIAATIDYMRGIERHGGAEILDRAFTGFAALPPPIEAQRPWWQVLEISKNGELAGVTIEDAEEAYRSLAKQLHPDIGGNAAQFAELSAAIRAARDSLKGVSP